MGDKLIDGLDKLILEAAKKRSDDYDILVKCREGILDLRDRLDELETLAPSPSERTDQQFWEAAAIAALGGSWTEMYGFDWDAASEAADSLLAERNKRWGPK